MNNEDIQLSSHTEKFAFIDLCNKEPVMRDNGTLIDIDYAHTLQKIAKSSKTTPITAALITESARTVAKEGNLDAVKENTITIKLLSHLSVTNEKLKSKLEKNNGITVSDVSKVAGELQTGISGHA